MKLCLNLVLIFSLLVAGCAGPIEEEAFVDAQYTAARDAYLAGDYEKAADGVVQLELKGVGPPFLKGKVLMLKALTFKQLQHYKESYEAFDNAALAFAKIGLYELEGQCLYQKGVLEGMAMDYANAYASCNAGLEALSNVEESVWRPVVEREVAHALLGLGDTAKAQLHFSKALEMQEDQSRKFYSHYYLGMCTYWQEDLEMASGSFGEALKIAASTNNGYYYSLATNALGFVAMGFDKPMVAIERFEEALLFDRPQSREQQKHIIKARKDLAKLYRQEYGPEKELEALEPLLALTQQLGGLEDWQDAVFDLQGLYGRAGRAEDVLRCAAALQEARSLPQEVVLQPYLLKVQMAQYREEKAQAAADKNATNLFNMALGLTLVCLVLIGLAVLIWRMYRQMRQIRQRLNQKVLAYENLSQMTSWMTEHYEPITRAAFNAFVGREPLKYKITRLKKGDEE